MYELTHLLEGLLPQRCLKALLLSLIQLDANATVLVELKSITNKSK